MTLFSRFLTHIKNPDAQTDIAIIAAGLFMVVSGIVLGGL